MSGYPSGSWVYACLSGFGMESSGPRRSALTNRIPCLRRISSVGDPAEPAFEPAARPEADTLALENVLHQSLAPADFLVHLLQAHRRPVGAAVLQHLVGVAVRLDIEERVVQNLPVLWPVAFQEPAHHKERRGYLVLSVQSHENGDGVEFVVDGLGVIRGDVAGHGYPSGRVGSGLGRLSHSRQPLSIPFFRLSPLPPL